MAALDTYVLVRYIVRDDARQLLAARRLFQKCIEAGQTLYAPVTVSIELDVTLAALADESPLWTFDKGAAKLDVALRLL